MKMTLVKEYIIAVSSTEDGIADIWYDEEEKAYCIYLDSEENWADTLEEAMRICDEYSEKVVAEDKERIAERRESESFNYLEWARQNY